MYIWQGFDEKNNFVLCWSFTWVPNTSLNCWNVFRFEAQVFCCFPVLKKSTSAVWSCQRSDNKPQWFLIETGRGCRSCFKTSCCSFHNVTLPRKSTKSSFCGNGIITACKLLMFFPCKLERRNWYCWRKQGQSGSSCDPLLLVILSGCWRRREDRMFQKWATNETLMAPLALKSGSPVLEWSLLQRLQYLQSTQGLFKCWLKKTTG